MPSLFGMKQLCILVLVSCYSVNVSLQTTGLHSKDPSAFSWPKRRPKVSKVCWVFFFSIAIALNWPPTLRLWHLAAGQSTAQFSTLQGSRWKSGLAQGKESLRQCQGRNRCVEGKKTVVIRSKNITVVSTVCLMFGESFHFVQKVAARIGQRCRLKERLGSWLLTRKHGRGYSEIYDTHLECR